MTHSAASPPLSWLPEGMDPKSSYLLKIKIFAKCVRKDISWFSFEKVVDSDTTNFKDLVEEIVNEFPPDFNDVVTVQYYDDTLKSFPQVKTDQELQSMFEKYAHSKVVSMCVAHSSGTPRIISQWPVTPSKESHGSAVNTSAILCPSEAAPSLTTSEPNQNSDDDNYLLNPLPENEHVDVHEEGLYLCKEHVTNLQLIVHGNKDTDNVPREDSSEFGSDSGSEFEFVEEWIGKDSMPDHIPCAAYNKEDPPMTVGSIYPNIEEFKLALSQHAIKNEFEFNTEKSEPDRFRAYCSRRKVDKCPWRIHASTMEDGVSMTVKINPCEHECTSTRRTKKAKNATKFWVCEKVKDWLIEDATLGAKELQWRIKDKYKVHVHYKRIYMGKDLALNQLYGNWDSSFDNLYRFKAEIERSSPQSFAVIDHHTINDKIRFKRFFFALKPCIDGFLGGCRPFLSIDSTFLIGRFKGQLDTACAVDGHNWMYPVAFGVMDAETNDNWVWFMQRLREAIGSPYGLTICTDAGQPIMTGVKEVFPEVEHRECMFHLVNNFKKRFHGKVFDDHLWAAAYSWHPYFFEKHWAAMEVAKPAAVEYLRSKHTKLWTRSQFSTLCKVDYVTNNLAESFNNWIKHHKTLNVDDLMDKIRQLLMIKWQQRRKVSKKLEGLVLPHIIKKLKERSRDLNLEVVECSNEVGEVTVLGGSGFRFVVKLHERTCSCRE